MGLNFYVFLAAQEQGQDPPSVDLSFPILPPAWSPSPLFLAASAQSPPLGAAKSPLPFLLS